MPFKLSIHKIIKAISLRFFLFTITLLLGVGAFALITTEVVIENENSFDYLIFQKIDRITNPQVTNLFEIVTFFGSSYFLLPAYLILICFFLFYKKNKKASLNIAAIGITSTLLMLSLKLIFKRTRPLEPLVQNVIGYSFPSGHSFSAFTFFGLLIYIVWTHQVKPIWRWVLTPVFFLFACAIAFSRVYLHVHFASDVIAGFCLCIIWLSVSFYIINKFEKK